jgi:pyruvate dehydrogenase E1 component alpha subunit
MRNCTVQKKKWKNTKNRSNYTLDVIMDKKYTEEEIEVIEQRVKDLVQECVDFAEESDYPPVQQLYDVVYEQENYPFIPHKL